MGALERAVPIACWDTCSNQVLTTSKMVLRVNVAKSSAYCWALSFLFLMYNNYSQLNILTMKLEDLTQHGLDSLLARARQRSVFAAIVAGVMSLELTSPEGLSIKRTMMDAVMKSMEMDIRVGDEIEQFVLIAMRDHCEEQLAMEDLLNSANL